jgi:CheY-like chemotaxis protein
MNRNCEANSRPSLLVVDDDEAIIELVESLLEDDVDVVCASNGWEALALAAEHQPDLVLLDLMMPGINGLTLTEELRKLPYAERLRIFIMTAQRGLLPEVERLEVDGFFAKPFEPDQLMEQLLDALSG